ncbi:uncharacterized protein [Haliotis cracherodii]|uniref:uncharacterized protein n=1 Tax=Haliotis cracherodii TaxID=6455 RepID=UPI0039E805B5
MEIERNYTVRLYIAIYMFLLIINSSKGAVCPTPDNEENIVRSMCLSGQISGKRVYLDTSYFSSNMDTCRCSITATGSGGSVTFSFPVVDSVNCDATIAVSSFNFIRNCSSGGSYSGFLDFNATVDLKLEGSGPVSHCMLVYTEAAEMMLSVSCYAATTVATPMTTEQITTTLEVIPPTTFASTTQGTSAVPVSSPTSQISTTEEVSSPTSSVFPTEPLLPVTEENQLAVCPQSDIPVVGMCRAGVQQGTRIYLDSTLFSGEFSRCSCSLRVVSEAGGSVDIYPTIIDRKNCESRIRIDAMKYSLDCKTRNGHVQRFLYSLNSLDLSISGQGAGRYCLLFQTKATAVRLQLECSFGISAEVQDTSTSSTSKTTPHVTSSLSPTPASKESVSSTTSQVTSTESITTPPSVTEGNDLAVCPQAAIPVVGMCRAGIQQGTRIYLDSTLFSGEFSSCSCSLRVVSAAGGSVDIYPTTIDRKNCKVSFKIDVLKYSLDCHKGKDHAQSFLHSLDSLDLDIQGQGAGRYCLLIQTKATEVRLQLQCYSGRFADSVNTTTSTTTFTQETPFVTTEAMVTSTSTPTPSTTTSATTPVSITEAPTTDQPTTEKTHKTTTVTSSAPSTSTITTEVLPTSPTEITPVPVTVPSQTTTTTTVSESTGLDNKTVLDDTQATLYSFPVVEVTAGVSAGIMVLLGIMVILLCNRFQDKHRGDEENERKQPIAGYADSEYSSANVSVLNPLYSEEAEPECSQQARQRPEEHGSDVSSSSSESPPSPSAGRTVTEVNAGQVELTYALVIKPNRGHTNCTEPPGRTKTEGSTHGLYRL